MWFLWRFSWLIGAMDGNWWRRIRRRVVRKDLLVGRMAEKREVALLAPVEKMVVRLAQDQLEWVEVDRLGLQAWARRTWTV